MVSACSWPRSEPACASGGIPARLAGHRGQRRRRPARILWSDSSTTRLASALGRDKGVFRRTLILVGVAGGAGSTDSGGAHATFGFPQGRSDYEPEAGVLLDYVGHGFKRFSRDRDRLGSAGICGACCPICCLRSSLVEKPKARWRCEEILFSPLPRRASTRIHPQATLEVIDPSRRADRATMNMPNVPLNPVHPLATVA